ncbi:coatomer subunit gamma [Tanacetum coccineum]
MKARLWALNEKVKTWVGNASGKMKVPVKSVDRLMKQITNFMSDIADEFNIVVVDAIRSLCLTFPLKYRTLFEYKKAIVNSIVILIMDIPDAKESGLLYLCEFIKDCEKVKKAVLTHWNKLKGNLISVKKVASLLQVCCSRSSFLR